MEWHDKVQKQNTHNGRRSMIIRSYVALMDYRATIEELISGGNIEVSVQSELVSLLTSESIPPIMSKSRKNRFLQEVSISIVSFAEKIGTEAATRKMKEMGLCPADIFNLLTLNRTYPASPGIKSEYALYGSIVSLGTILPKRYNGKILEGVGLAPILSCEDGPRDPLKRRELSLNLTEYVNDLDGLVRKYEDWWPIGTQFVCMDDMNENAFIEDNLILQ